MQSIDLQLVGLISFVAHEELQCSVGSVREEQPQYRLSHRQAHANDPIIAGYVSDFGYGGGRALHRDRDTSQRLSGF